MHTITKSIAIFVTAALVLNAMAPALAQATADSQSTKVNQTPIQRIKTPNAKVRVHAPVISKRRIIGEVVKMNRDTLVLKLARMPWPQLREITANTVMTQDGQTLYQVPMSSITNLEVSMGRRRNAGKSFMIGLGLGLAVLVPVAIADSKESSSDELPLGEGLATVITAVYIFPSIVVLSTLIGVATKYEKWVKISPQRLNLSIAPTPEKGFRAALTVNF